MFVMSLCQLGFIVSYMSDSFISGYIAAASVLVSHPLTVCVRFYARNTQEINTFTHHST